MLRKCKLAEGVEDRLTRREMRGYAQRAPVSRSHIVTYDASHLFLDNENPAQGFADVDTRYLL